MKRMRGQKSPSKKPSNSHKSGESRMPKVKVLSVPQPRASELVIGDRFIENRTWPIDHKSKQARMPVSCDEWLYIFASPATNASAMTPEARIANAIIGRLKVYDVVRSDVLEILAALEPDATELTDDAARMVAVQDPALFFQRHRHLLDFFQFFQITPQQFARQVTGPVCWLVHEVQPLYPIAGRSRERNWLGREGIWEIEVPDDQIVEIRWLDISQKDTGRLVEQTREFSR